MALLRILRFRQGLQCVASAAASLLRRSYSPGGTPSIHLPTIFAPREKDNPLGPGFRIAVVDTTSWTLPFEAAEFLGTSSSASLIHSEDPATSEYCPVHDFDDEIDEMRLRKHLFYKVERDSMEFDECNVFLNRKRAAKNGETDRELSEASLTRKIGNGKDSDCSELPRDFSSCAMEMCSEEGSETVSPGTKRLRMPSFENLTDPFHRPFCLDIQVTKGSVRACVVHRVTSRVVAVAHSISKDLKHDLGCRKPKDARACETVGAVLAKRSLEDDVHNVMYTPRNGDKIEGKIAIVLCAIRENGLDVEVKLKQHKHRRIQKRSPMSSQGLI